MKDTGKVPRQDCEEAQRSIGFHWVEWEGFSEGLTFKLTHDLEKRRGGQFKLRSYQSPFTRKVLVMSRNKGQYGKRRNGGVNKAID